MLRFAQQTVVTESSIGIGTASPTPAALPVLVRAPKHAEGPEASGLPSLHEDDKSRADTAYRVTGWVLFGSLLMRRLPQLQVTFAPWTEGPRTWPRKR